MELLLYVGAITAILTTLYVMLRPLQSPGYALLGVVLPIDFIQGVPPVMLDAIRYLLIVILIFRNPPTPARNTHSLALGTTVALTFLNFGVLIKGFVAYDSSYALVGVIGLISLVASYLVIRSATSNQLRAICLGFFASMLASSLDIFSQIRGATYFGAPSEWGIRFSGFSFTATKAGPLFAIAILIVIASWVWKGLPWKKSSLLLRTLGLLSLAFGLFHTGGRGGLLAALVAVLLVILQWRWRVAAVLVVTICVLLTLDADLRGRAFGLFVREGIEDVSSGRFERNEAAWESFITSPLFGPQPAAIADLSPHAAILTFAIAFGAFGLIISSIITLRCGVLSMQRLKRHEAASFIRGGAAISFVIALLEPAGLYVGLSSLIPLIITLELYGRYGKPDADKHIVVATGVELERNQR